MSESASPTSPRPSALFPSNGKPGVQAAIAKQESAANAQIEMNTAGQIVEVGFNSAQGFDILNRIAKAFAASTLVPQAYQGNIANCIIAVEMAKRMGASPLMVMQNLYIVHGNPSWSAKFTIAAFNQCGRFTAIKYRWVGEKGKPSFGCIAYAREKSTGELVESPAVTWQVVKAEGWDAKKGSKWLTLADLMFMYRSATFLVRTTAPELTMGLQTAEEIEDIGPRAEYVEEPRGLAGMREALGVGAPPHNPETGELIDPTGAAPTEAELAEARAREAAEAAGR